MCDEWSRIDGLDQCDRFSDDFNNGVTAGTLTRNGGTIRLSNSPLAGGVRATLSAKPTAGASWVFACVGALKKVGLDALGETADILCEPSTGTITVKATSASPRIQVWKQQSDDTWTVAELPTGATYSTGSPATASANNREPIDVSVVQLTEAGAIKKVGSFRLAPGDSVDVTVGPTAPGETDRVGIKVLRGRVAISLRGFEGSLEPGESTRGPRDRIPPAAPKS